MTLRAGLAHARQITDALLPIVRPSSFYDRPIPLRHRIIFYLGHLEAFDLNLLGHQLDVPSCNPHFDKLFAFGIDPGAGNIPSDEPRDWPKVDEVRTYVSRVRESLDAVLDDVPEQLLHVAIEHRLMHAETLAYILHHIPYDRKVPIEASASRADSTPSARMIQVGAGAVPL